MCRAPGQRHAGLGQLALWFVMFFLVREGSIVSPSVAEIVTVGLAVATAGTSRRVASGWAIIAMQAVSNLFLAAGGACSPPASLASVVSFGLYYQKSARTFLHRLTASPTDMTLVYRCWLA